MRAFFRRLATTGMAVVMIIGLLVPSVTQAFDLLETVPTPNSSVVLNGDNDRDGRLQVDFGNVEANDTESFQFLISNLGTQAVRLDNVRALNGAASIFTIGEEGKVISGQSSGTFTVTVDPNSVGEFSARFALDFRTANTRADFVSTQIVTTRVNSFTRTVTPTPSPSRVITISDDDINFGTVDVDKTAGPRSVRIYNRSNRTVSFSVTDTPSSSSDFDADVFTNSSFIPANGSVRVDFFFTPEREATQRDEFSFVADGREYTIELEGRGDDDRTSRSDESLIQDFRVYQDADLYNAYPNTAIRVYFELERNADVTLKVCDDRGYNCKRVFTDRYFSAVSTNRQYTFVLPERLSATRDYRVELYAVTERGTYDRDYDTLDEYNNVRVRPVTPPTPGPYRGQGGYYPEGGCAGFVDVAPGTEFCAAVEYAVDAGIFRGDDVRNGYGRTLRPNDPLNRAEGVMVITRAGRVNPAGETTVLPFYDIDERQTYIPALRSAVRLKAIRGYADGTFRPGKTMTRDEFYKAFLEFMKQRGTGNYIINYDKLVSPFADVNWAQNRWFVPYAEMVTRYFDRSPEAERWFGTRDLRGDKSNAFFKPGDEITRGHIIELVYAMSKRNLIKL